jgi:hypothetical protein
MERSGWLQRCLVNKLGAPSIFLGANIRFHEFCEAQERLLDPCVNCMSACLLVSVYGAGSTEERSVAVKPPHSVRHTHS